MNKLNIKGQVQKGFTLIELMITVAIVGILSAVAIPSYQDYTNRAKASEAMVLLDSTKLQYSEYIQAEGGWPATLAAAGITTAPTGKYAVISADATDTLTATFTAASGTDLSTKTVTLTHAAGVWTCAPGTVDAKFLPKSCQ